MDGKNSIADDILRNGFERWQRLEGEKQAISDDLKELFAELKGQGFDGKALRAAFRTVAKAGDTDVQDHNAMVDLYVDSLMAPRVGQTGTVPATRRHAAREEAADPVAALRADPAMAIVDAGNLKKNTEHQPPQQAGQAQASANVCNAPTAGASTSLSGAEGAEDREPIQPETANDCPQPPEFDQRLSVAGPKDATGRQSVDTLRAERGRPGDGVTAGETAPVPDADQSVEASASAAPVSKYAAPGIVTWENTPPEPVKRHDYSSAFGDLGQDIAVIEDDLANSASEPIVKIGNQILDGWARYTKARSMVGLDGMPIDYPTLQYDGADPLMDCIRWNLAGRIMNDAQKRTVAQRLARLDPRRKAEIYAAFELGMELVGA